MITYTNAATMDIELHIRHGSALALQNLRWLVTPQVVNEPLLSRFLLKALRFARHEDMRAAADQLEGSIDLSNIVDNESDCCTGRVGR